MVPKAFISVKHMQRVFEWMMRASWAVAHFYCCKGFWVIIFVYRQWSSNPEKIELFPALLWIYTMPPAFTPSYCFIHVCFFSFHGTQKEMIDRMFRLLFYTQRMHIVTRVVKLQKNLKKIIQIVNMSCAYYIWNLQLQ